MIFKKYTWKFDVSCQSNYETSVSLPFLKEFQIQFFLMYPHEIDTFDEKKIFIWLIFFLVL